MSNQPDLGAEIAKHMGDYTYSRTGNHDRVVDLVTDDLRPFVRAAVEAAYLNGDGTGLYHQDIPAADLTQLGPYKPTPGGAA